MKTKASHFFPWKWKLLSRGGFSDIYMVLFSSVTFICGWMTAAMWPVTPTALGKSVLREAAGWNGMSLPGDHVTSPARSRFPFSIKLQTQGFKSASLFLPDLCPVIPGFPLPAGDSKSMNCPSGSTEDMEEPGIVRKVVIFVLQSWQHCVQEAAPLSLHLTALSYRPLRISLQGWPLGG